MNGLDPGRLAALVYRDIGLDVPGLSKELRRIPKSIYLLRQANAPLKAEAAMLQARFEAKGPRSPSHFDLARAMLVSELKEEARRNYAIRPDVKEDSKGVKKWVPLTDGRAEDLAHCDQKYKDFVREAGEQMLRLAEISKEMGENFNRIEALRGKKEYLLQKLKQAEALTFAWSAEQRETR